jgi:hypothetical protein
MAAGCAPVPAQVAQQETRRVSEPEQLVNRVVYDSLLPPEPQELPPPPEVGAGGWLLAELLMPKLLVHCPLDGAVLCVGIKPTAGSWRRRSRWSTGPGRPAGCSCSLRTTPRWCLRAALRAATCGGLCRCAPQLELQCLGLGADDL